MTDVAARCVLKVHVDHVLVPTSAVPKDGSEDDYTKVQRVLSQLGLGKIPILKLSQPPGKAFSETMNLVDKLIGRKQATMAAKLMEIYWNPGS